MGRRICAGLLGLAILLGASAQLAHADEESDACLKCHGNADELRKSLQDPSRPIESLVMDPEVYARSVHMDVSCTDCHEDFDEHPHPTDGTTMSCAECHEEAAELHAKSPHGKTVEGKEGPAAACADCHGIHDIFKSDVRESRLHPLNVYKACGQCHFDVDPTKATPDQILHEKLSDDSHARGILKGGLIHSATCVTCHGTHEIHAAGDVNSPLARERVEMLCAQCHLGVVEEYRKSVHYLRPKGFPNGSKEDAKEGDEKPDAATCTDCHKPHHVNVRGKDFHVQTVATCGECHREQDKSFGNTYHGKVVHLGAGERVATCDRCHGHHGIRAQSDPESMINEANIVGTCGQCHEGSHAEFATYMVHADPGDGEKYPRIHFIYVVMNSLLIGTLILGCLHALMWLIRALAAGDHKKPAPVAAVKRYFRRWPRSYVVYHIWMMTTVLALACTGLPLFYSDQRWAVSFMNFFGGAPIAAFIHRFGGFSLGLLFLVYFIHLLFRIRSKREPDMFSPGNTMLPRWKDFTDLFGNIRWFLFLAPRPKYDRWTYWEKFDFWAATWGLFVIGITGLMLWFPVAWTHLVPGWFINAAVVVHGIEALLDIAFIFTVHIFHANLRPDKFPMDTAFLTGVISEEEFKHERPAEYERAVRAGVLDAMMTANRPTRRKRTVAYIIGTCALAVGFFFVGAMIVAVIQKLG